MKNKNYYYIVRTIPTSNRNYRKSKKNVYIAYYSGVCVTRSLMCIFCRSLFVLFLLAIVLSVLLRLTDSDYPFSIFTLLMVCLNHIEKFHNFIDEMKNKNYHTVGIILKIEERGEKFHI